MLWKELSRDAKNVIEWVEDPYTGKKKEITIKIGEVFSPMSDIKIFITEELFEEITKFIRLDENMCYELKDDIITFWLKS